MVNFVFENSTRCMRSCAHVIVSHVSVTWRDVTFCHDMMEARYYPELSDRQLRAISGISSDLRALY
eukprot:732918-Amorphochlora_amoeboformis.AAC.1